MRDVRVKLGCEALIDKKPDWLRSARLGVLANQASVAGSFEHVVSLIQKGGGNLCCLFSPQHGFYSEKQANMIESEDDWDSLRSIPIHSLYGSVRQPTAEMLEPIDVLIIDLPDVGTRVYTYGATMGLCLEKAASVGVKAVVLDRPNPVNGISIEGSLLREDHRSFVGRYGIPMRHGLTLGEMARFIVRERLLDCDLEVVPAEGWRRGDFFPDTRLPWVFPSPNMPSWETALLYPGMVLFEGTNMSEGRGTTLPFHLFGAPFLDQAKLLRRLDRRDTEGVFLRPVCFEPVFDKWRGKMCRGFQIHITERDRLHPYRLGLALLKALLEVHSDDFQWLPPPYEYETEKLPIDILLGDGSVRKKIEEGMSLDDLEAGWTEELDAYWKSCGEIMLYPE